MEHSGLLSIVVHCFPMSCKGILWKQNSYCSNFEFVIRNCYKAAKIHWWRKMPKLSQNLNWIIGCVLSFFFFSSSELTLKWNVCLELTLTWTQASIERKHKWRLFVYLICTWRSWDGDCELKSRTGLQCRQLPFHEMCLQVASPFPTLSSPRTFYCTEMCAKSKSVTFPWNVSTGIFTFPRTFYCCCTKM